MSNDQLPALAGAPKSMAHMAPGHVAAIVPQNLDDVFRLGRAVAQSGLAPYGMRSAEQCAVAIMTGLEIGVKPMQAIQGIAVINGRPCVWGDLALAICQSTGEIEHMSETFEGEEPDEWTLADQPKQFRKFKAVCRVKRKGWPEVTNEFSIGDAIVAKLWQKKGGQNSDKDTPWVTNPKRMLKMRARGFSLRDTFADALKGLYIAEELQGTEEIDNRSPVAPPPPAEVRQAIEDGRKAQQPAEAKPAGPQAPPVQQPAEAVDAEIIEPGAGGQQAVQEPHETAGAAGSPAEPEPEAFDVPAFLDEAEQVFAGCRTESDINEAHNGFADRVEANLTRPQRELYAEAHTKALERVEQASAQAQELAGSAEGTDTRPAPSLDDEDEQPAPEPPPHEVAAAAVRRDVDNCTTAAEIGATWNAWKGKLREMVKAGEMEETFRKGIYSDLNANYERMLAQETGTTKAADPETPKPGPATEQPAGGDAPDSEAAKFTEEFKASIAALTDMNGLNALTASTVERRDALAAGNPDLREVWRVMLANARKKFAGL